VRPVGRGETGQAEAAAAPDEPEEPEEDLEAPDEAGAGDLAADFDFESPEDDPESDDPEDFPESDDDPEDDPDSEDDPEVAAAGESLDSFADPFFFDSPLPALSRLSLR
jgi:hypothetical protein